MNIENLSLTDFTSNELRWLYLILEKECGEIQNKIEIIEKMDPSRLKYELYDHQCAMLNNCTQWMTKLDEAEKFVKTREIMTTEN